MKLLVGGRDISEVITRKMGNGKIVLFKMGQGSGGDLLLRQFFIEVPEGTYPVWISTHESEEEMMGEMKDLEIRDLPEMWSLLSMYDESLNDIEKRDRFIKEGIMVTDLLEISSNTRDRMVQRKPHMTMLSSITTTASKQVLPFRMVLDSIVDLVRGSSTDDTLDRLMILKKALRDKGGIALIACPLEYGEFRDYENTLFDGVIEVRCERTGNGWKRKMVFANIKGSGEPPEEFIIAPVEEIPTALSVD